MGESDFFVYNKDLIQKMRKTPFLSSFEEKDLMELLRMSEIRQYKPGEVILEEGSYGSWIYYLISGKAKVVKKEEEVYVLEKTGDVFGEMGVIDGSARSASVYAVEDTMCLAMDFSFEKFPIDDQEKFKLIIYREFAEILATRLRVTTEELIRTREELVETTEELDALKGGGQND